jgi:hypothetical protein
MKRLDQGHLHPKLEVPGLTCPGRRAHKKESFEQIVNSYSEHPHISARPVENARDSTIIPVLWSDSGPTPHPPPPPSRAKWLPRLPVFLLPVCTARLQSLASEHRSYDSTETLELSLREQECLKYNAQWIWDPLLPPPPPITPVKRWPVKYNVRTLGCR